MTRLVIVVALGALIVVGNLWYRSRVRQIEDRSGLDLAELPDPWRGPGRTWVVFATKFCATCGPVVDRLRAAHPDDTVHKILVEEHPGLASAYAVRTAPTLVVADGTGRVTRSIAGAGPVLEHLDELTIA